MNGRFISSTFAAVYALCILLILPSFASAGELKTMTFIPQWLPQAQFAGYYVACEKGFYRNRGIDLKIIKGGPGYPPGQMLASKKADFATFFLSEALQLRDKDVKLINIGQIVKRSGFILVAKKGSGILKPEDLNNKKISMWENFRIHPEAFFQKYNIKTYPVAQGTTVNLFLRGGVDAASAMWYNEYHTILNSGWNEDELTLFFLDQYGLNFPEDGIYVLEETFKRDPYMCCDFVRASIEGWKYAFEKPDEAIDIIMKYAAEAKTGTNRTHQKWMLAKIKTLIQPEGSKTPMGVLEEKDYQFVANELFESGIIGRYLPFVQFNVNCIRERDNE